jgi:hypothetical protein
MGNPKDNNPNFGQPRLESPVIDASYTTVDPSPAAQEGPGKWEKTAAALTGVGGLAVGGAIETAFTGTSEFVSRFFGLPEGKDGPQSPERQQEPDKDKDREPGRDR